MSEVEPAAVAAAGYFSENRFMAVALNPQSITFPEISTMTYPAAPFALVANATQSFEVEAGSGSWVINPLAGETVAEIDADLERVTVTDHAVPGKRFGRVRVVAD